MGADRDIPHVRRRTRLRWRAGTACSIGATAARWPGAASRPPGGRAGGSPGSRTLQAPKERHERACCQRGRVAGESASGGAGRAGLHPARNDVPDHALRAPLGVGAPPDQPAAAARDRGRVGPQHQRRRRPNGRHQRRTRRGQRRVHGDVHLLRGGHRLCRWRHHAGGMRRRRRSRRRSPTPPGRP